MLSVTLEMTSEIQWAGYGALLAAIGLILIWQGSGKISATISCVQTDLIKVPRTKKFLCFFRYLCLGERSPGLR